MLRLFQQGNDTGQSFPVGSQYMCHWFLTTKYLHSSLMLTILVTKNIWFVTHPVDGTIYPDNIILIKAHLLNARNSKI